MNIPEQVISRRQSISLFLHTDEELESERQTLMAQEKMPIYQGKCRNLTQEQKNELLAAGRKPTVRFKTPENQQIIFDDMVRGTVSF